MEVVYVLGGAPAPRGLGVQHARDDGPPRVEAVLGRVLSQELAALAFLPPVVTAGVLRRVGG